MAVGKSRYLFPTTICMFNIVFAYGYSQPSSVF